MEIQERILKFVTRANWILFAVAGISALALSTPGFTRGILSGGLIVTVNFHLLSRTLKKAFRPPHLASPRVVLAKYYIRFVVSGIIIFILLANHYVDPLGLIAGLSVVVASILLATVCEVKKLLFKEAI